MLLSDSRMREQRSFQTRVQKRALPLVLALLAVAGCGKKTTQPPPGPLAVNVVTATAKEVTAWNEFTGRMEAVDSVEIRPRVSGYITEVRFKAGDLVKEGDPLFVIDPRPYQAELDRATANVDQALAQQKLAEIDFQRVETLKQKQVVAAEEYDKKAAALTQAEATARASQAAKETAALNVGFTDIKSPIAGRAGDVRVTIGNLVSTDTLLTTVVSTDPFYVYVDADENSVLKFMKEHSGAERKSVREAKTPAFVELSNEKDFPHKGYIDFVDNRVDPSTGTLRLRGVFKSWDPLLAPGFFVRMRIPLGKPESAVLIPDEVISSQQNLKFVYVVKPDNTIERRTIETGPVEGDKRVVRSGLKAGEKVVSTRLQLLRPGMTVKPVPEENPTPPANPTASPK